MFSHVSSHFDILNRDFNHFILEFPELLMGFLENPEFPFLDHGDCNHD